MERIVGVIYPVPGDIVDALFSGGSKVFVKYIPHKSTRLVKGNKVFFYASKGLKSLVGEGVIESIEFLSPENVLDKYSDLLFLNREQFDGYVKMRPTRDPSKEILTLKLVKIKKYKKPIECEKAITMAGRYVSSQEYSNLIS